MSGVLVETGQRRIGLHGRMRRVPGLGAIPTMVYSHPRGPAFEVDAFRRGWLMRAGARGACNLVLPQRPNFHLFILPATGTVAHAVDFVDYCCAPGTLLHVRPGQVHRWTPCDVMDAICVICGPSFLTRTTVRGDLLRDDAEHPVPLVTWPTLFTLTPDVHEQLGRVFELVLAHHEASTDATRSAPFLRQLVQAAFVLLTQAAADADPTVPRGTRELFERFVRLLDARYATARDVAGYAAALAVAPRTLTRACEAASERTAKALIDDRVAVEAKRLLAYSSLSIAEVAAHLNFSEPTNFVKFFRRTAGESPTRFRQRETRET